MNLTDVKKREEAEATEAEGAEDEPEVVAIATGGKQPPAEPPEPPAPSTTSVPERPLAGGPLTRLMELPEPARTVGLEQAVNNAVGFSIRAKADQPVHVRYGEVILVVPPQGREFMAAHAIHMLWTAKDLVEEFEPVE